MEHTLIEERQNHPCKYFKATEQDSVTKLSEVRVFVSGCCRLKLISRMWSISPSGSQTPPRPPSQKGSAVPLKFQVTGILWICPRADRDTRASVPSNVLENSLTRRSVALHLLIVASQLFLEQKLLWERQQGMWDSVPLPPPKKVEVFMLNLQQKHWFNRWINQTFFFNFCILSESRQPLCLFFCVKLHGLSSP